MSDVFVSTFAHTISEKDRPNGLVYAEEFQAIGRRLFTAASTMGYGLPDAPSLEQLDILIDYIGDAADRFCIGNSAQLENNIKAFVHFSFTLTSPPENKPDEFSAVEAANDAVRGFLSLERAIEHALFTYDDLAAFPQKVVMEKSGRLTFFGRNGQQEIVVSPVLYQEPPAALYSRVKGAMRGIRRGADFSRFAARAKKIRGLENLHYDAGLSKSVSSFEAADDTIGELARQVQRFFEQELDFDIPYNECLEFTAKAIGYASWNVLSGVVAKVATPEWRAPHILIDDISGQAVYECYREYAGGISALAKRAVAYKHHSFRAVHGTNIDMIFMDAGSIENEEEAAIPDGLRLKSTIIWDYPEEVLDCVLDLVSSLEPGDVTEKFNSYFGVGKPYSERLAFIKNRSNREGGLKASSDNTASLEIDGIFFFIAVRFIAGGEITPIFTLSASPNAIANSGEFGSYDTFDVNKNMNISLLDGHLVITADSAYEETGNKVNITYEGAFTDTSVKAINDFIMEFVSRYAK